MARQRFSSPRLQTAQSPQPIQGCASRRSPILTPCACGPDRHHLADVLVAERHRQLHAAIGEAHALAAAEIEIAVGEMQVAVADAGGQHLQQHLGAGRLGRRAARCSCSGCAAVADLEAAHCGCLPVAGHLSPVIPAGRSERPEVAPPPHRRRRAALVSRSSTVSGAVERAVERRQHPALGEIERRRLPVARTRQVDRDLVDDAARTRPHHHDAVGEHDRPRRRHG